MPAAERRRSLEEAVRLGRETYERLILPQLRPEDNDKFYAVEIVTGEYELDTDDHAALRRLKERCPSGEIYLGRVGHRAAHKMRGVR